jgi:hydrogenase expression/formation protein HypC
VSVSGTRERPEEVTGGVCLGIPGRVVEVSDADGLRMAKVDFGGIHKDVCLEYTPEAGLGDFVIVHVGFAITRLDEEEARRTFAILEQMGDMVRVELDPASLLPEASREDVPLAEPTP